MPKNKNKTPSTPRPLREIRESKYWSMTTVAKLAHVDRVTVWRAEHGMGLPHRRTMRAIAAVLSVPPEEIAEFVVKPNAEDQESEGQQNE